MLNRVSVAIKTFLRDMKLYRTIASIRRNMPEVQMLIADDGEMTEEKDSLYAELIREGHKVFILPFDSGFGKKANKIIDNFDRDLLLVGSDDFDFSPPSVRLGIKTLVETLNKNTELSIVSGRLGNRGPYEFHLLEDNGIITEWPTQPFMAQYYAGYVECDVTVNYSLIRKEVFQKVRFDDEEIIGEGGHGAFFYDVKKLGLKVGWVPGVEISEQVGQDSERYRQFRNRASRPSRKCFQKRGIRKWVLGSGQVDYDVTKEIYDSSAL